MNKKKNSDHLHLEHRQLHKYVELQSARWRFEAFRSADIEGQRPPNSGRMSKPDVRWQTLRNRKSTNND